MASAVRAAPAVIGVAWAHGPTRQKVRESIEIEVEPSSGGISVRTRYPSERSGFFRNISYSVDYEITMPEAALLTELPE